MGWTGDSYYVTALSVGAIVGIAAANAGATSQDLKTGYLVGATPRLQQYAILLGAFATALALGPILLKLNDAGTVYVPVTQLSAQEQSLRPHAALATLPSETLIGEQGKGDSTVYHAWHNTDPLRARPGKYLFNQAGQAVYFVDPGINGTFTTRPDGSEVRKFDAPKAVLMSYIIKGMLDRQLPWALILFGVVIALLLEMARVPALPFAVGVYLPLASSAPILIGGAVRWLVDRQNHPRNDEATRFEKGDQGPGVLGASGFIAGGAIAGIAIAFGGNLLGGSDFGIEQWSSIHNPFYTGEFADALSVVPFALLAAWLWRCGRQRE
jgi:uncharacterized oligopeptide transporter (OPT) family protein